MRDASAPAGSNVLLLTRRSSSLRVCGACSDSTHGQLMDFLHEKVDGARPCCLCRPWGCTGSCKSDRACRGRRGEIGRRRKACGQNTTDDSRAFAAVQNRPSVQLSSSVWLAACCSRSGLAEENLN